MNDVQNREDVLRNLVGIIRNEAGGNININLDQKNSEYTYFNFNNKISGKLYFQIPIGKHLQLACFCLQLNSSLVTHISSPATYIPCVSYRFSMNFGAMISENHFCIVTVMVTDFPFPSSSSRFLQMKPLLVLILIPR